MDVKYKSSDIMKRLNSKRVNVFQAASNRSDVYFENEDIESFLVLIEKLQIDVIFINVTKLEREDLEIAVITDEDIAGSYVREILSTEVKQYNNSIKKLFNYVGCEQDIELFFVYQGLIFQCMLFNDGLSVRSKTDFIDELKVKYFEEIQEAKEKLVDERINQVNDKLTKLMDYLINDKTFFKCTNVTLRKGYLFDLLRSDVGIDVEGVPAKLIYETVEDAWRKVKLDSTLKHK